MGAGKILAILSLSFHAAGYAQSNQELLKQLQDDLAELRRDQSTGPRKTFITPSTREVGYAMYYKLVQRRIEKIGTENFPNVDGKRLYGKLIVNIPIFQDGSIFEKDGGPNVERSSGDELLDQFALKIVRQAAPFDPLPASLRNKDRDDLIVVITSFNFTNEKNSVSADEKTSGE